MIEMEDVERQHFISLSSYLFSKNVLLLDIPETLTTFHRLFERTEEMLDVLPDDIQSVWFQFLLDLLPAIEVVVKEIEGEFKKSKLDMAEKHPKNAALVALLDHHNPLVLSSWTPEDRKIFYGWCRNFRRRVARRFDRVIEPAVELAVPILQLNKYDEDQNAYDRMMVGKIVIAYCKEVSLCWMNFPTASRDHFFDLLRRTLGFFDHQVFMNQQGSQRGDA